MKKIPYLFSSLHFQIILTTFIFLFLSACRINKTHLASDAKTGKYLGVVMTETRDYESKEVINYLIGDGEKRFEKLPQEITIYEP